MKAAVSGVPDLNAHADLPDTAAFLEIIGMNYEFDYDYSGGNCSMIYSSGGGKEIDERIWGIVKADPERLFLLPVRIEKTWSGYLLFYDITNATNMRAWRSEATRQEYLRMDRQIQVAVEQLEGAGISRQCLVLQEQHMFVDDRTGEIRFICIPLREMSPEPVREAAPEPRRESAWEPVPEAAPEPHRESAWEPVREAAPEPRRESAWEPVHEAAPEPRRESAWEPVHETAPEPRRESAWEPVHDMAPKPQKEEKPDLPPFVPGSPDEWNPAEGRDFWTPESEKWGENWDADGEGWNPAEERNAWESAEDQKPETENSSEWHPEEPAMKEEPWAPEEPAMKEEPWAPEEPAMKEEAWAPEEPAVKEEPSAPEVPPAHVPEAWSDEDEATQLLLPSQKAPLEKVPEAVIMRIRTGETYTIKKAVTVIGKRERTVDFCLKNNPALSRDHCVIRFKDGSFYIEDLNSSNFTYVDGVRVMPETEAELQNGCKIQLADEQFTFTIIAEE